jgi:hypothetical protein
MDDIPRPAELSALLGDARRRLVETGTLFLTLRTPLHERPSSPTSIFRSPGFGWVPPFLLNKAYKCRC